MEINEDIKDQIDRQTRNHGVLVREEQNIGNYTKEEKEVQSLVEKTVSIGRCSRGNNRKQKGMWKKFYQLSVYN